MSALLRIIDRVLGGRFKLFLDSILPPAPGLFAGGQKYTQALDIGHSANLIMEKALDLESTGSLSQADVQRYSDNLARVPIESSVLELASSLRPCALEIGDVRT